MHRRIIPSRFVLWSLGTLLCCSSTVLAGITYYVDANQGADTNSGTSPASAWQTVAKVNRTPLNPGDTVLFSRGGVWAEELNIYNSGTPDHPITIADYGQGNKPLLDGGNELRNGLHANGQNYIVVRNIAVANAIYGFLFDGGAAHNTVDSVEASFNLYDGIGFQDPGSVGNTALNSSSHDNGRCGVFFWSGADNGVVSGGSYYNNRAKWASGVGIAASSDALVADVSTYSNYYGIKIDVNAANILVKNATTYNNSSDGIDIDYTGSGIVLEKNTSYNNGDHGIDVEGDSPGTVVRYNVTHNNGARNRAGIMLDSSIGVQVYYNLLYNEAVGIWAYAASSPSLYNNTVANTTTCFGVQNGASDVTIANNIAALCGSLALYVASDSATGLTSNYNDWSIGDGPGIQWGQATYTLTQWRITSLQDIASIDADPGFVNPVFDDFRLSGNSPAIAKGANFGFPLDIFGTPVPQATAVDLGAYQAGSNPVPPQSQIVARHSGKCLDVLGISAAPGAPIQQWSCWGGPNQQWTLAPIGDGSYEIVSVNSGLSLDVSNLSVNGAAIIQWAYRAGGNERWLLQPISAGYYQLVAQGSGQCVDVSGGPGAINDGSLVQQWPCWGSTNQQWQLVPLN